MEPKPRPRPIWRHLAPEFILGVATGLLAGVLVSLSPFLAVIAVAAVLIITVTGIAQNADLSRSMFLAGGLVGAGALVLFGAVNTIAACSGTDDFCGNANVWPLSVLALGTIGSGAVSALVITLRDRRKAV